MAKKKAKAPSSKVWALMATVTALGAAAVARKGLDKGWQATTGRKPPANPADPDVDIWEAVTWAAVTGAAVALARMFAQRKAAHYYVKSTGQLPPQLAHDGK
ncbi:DUF4235 domain-containing protein [Nocardioides sp. Kera G14]|uniref:DUF4235 domain-containing protein n=1 Tax=Nocardioides sp. Kera G14 TaxID=2884264 RepID=UPI001D0FF263|nr:DUF4235 domain-containing protein [Nocardioides sp. Kera G14]UDY22366.1 DUF4235 domain-containing protein [Nocardioides sp. Kera G14]